MVRFGQGFGGILALILTVLIIYTIRIGIMMLLWKVIVVELFGLPMINIGQTIGLWFLCYLFSHGSIFKPVIIKTRKYEEDIEQ